MFHYSYHFIPTIYPRYQFKILLCFNIDPGTDPRESIIDINLFLKRDKYLTRPFYRKLKLDPPGLLTARWPVNIRIPKPVRPSLGANRHKSQIVPFDWCPATLTVRYLPTSLNMGIGLFGCHRQTSFVLGVAAACLRREIMLSDWRNKKSKGIGNPISHLCSNAFLPVGGSSYKIHNLLPNAHTFTRVRMPFWVVYSCGSFWETERFLAGTDKSIRIKAAQQVIRCDGWVGIVIVHLMMTVGKSSRAYAECW